MIIIHKTNTALAFLWCNLKPFLHIKTKCYLGIVRPIIEYDCRVWAPHTAQDINRIKMIQRRAAQFVYHNYYHSVSVSSMLKSLGWPTLQVRRNYLKLLLICNFLMPCMISIPPGDFKPVTLNTREYQSHLQCMQSACDSYHNSFFPPAIRLWNCLSVDIATTNNFHEFNLQLQQLL